MLNRLYGVEKRFDEVEMLLSDPKIINDLDQYQKYVRERADLENIVVVFRSYKQVMEDIEGSRELLRDSDPEIKELARDEIAELNGRLEELEAQLKLLLLPKDPNDDKNVIIEIRAGTGGEEAALFASDLFRMYSRYAEQKGWKVEIMGLSSNRRRRIEGNNRHDSWERRVQPIQI